MQRTHLPIDTARLKVGMYVAMLDRPWLETPFVFQGFEIKDTREIEQLRSYCSRVMVEVERGQLTEDEILRLSRAGTLARQHATLSAQSAERSSWLQKVAVRVGLGRMFNASAKQGEGPYPRTATVRREAPAAKLAYDNCVAAYREVFAEARQLRALNMQAVNDALVPVIDSILRNPDAMAWTVFSGKRSNRNYSRAVATAVWAVMFGRHLEFDRKRLNNLAAGGLLLDIGYVALPDELLQATGAIDRDEYQQVLRHVQAGIDILRRTRDVDPVVFEMLVYHHERCDGSGYPNKLQAGDIPPHGRIAGIVDCYDAMTTKTAYSPAMAAYDAARELNEMREREFHAEVVEQFLKTVGMFPTGSIVELNDRSAGLVVEQNPSHPLQPKVLLLKSAAGETLDPARIFTTEDWQEGRLWIEKGHEHGAFGIDPMAYFNQPLATQT